MTAHPPLAGNPRGAVAFVFDQPMVDARNPPTPPPNKLHITPPTHGKLQWLGDRTLVFAPHRRLRYATQYTFRLRPPPPPGSNAQPQKEVFTGFTTMAPALLESTPATGAREVDVQPVISLRFNQPMDAQVVRQKLRLLGPGAPTLTSVAPLQNLGPNVVWLRPAKALRPSTDYQLLLPADLRGAEGTIGSLALSRIRFTTAGPLRLRAARCQTGPCRPGDALLLDTAGSPGPVCGLLKVTPPVEDLRCRVRSGQVVLTGTFHSETRYTLRLVPDGDAEPAPRPPIAITFGRREQPLAFFPNRPLLTAWTGSSLLPVSGADRAKLRVAPVQPEMVSTLLTAIADPGALPPFQLTRQPPRRLPVHDRGTGFDLRSLGARPALLLASLEETVPRGVKTRVLRRTALVQRTGLSVVARYGWTAGVALVAGTEDGKPTPGVPMRIRNRAGRTLWRGQTDVRGLAHFPGRRRLRRAGPFTLWAEKGADRSFLVLDGGGEDEIRTPGYLRGQRLPAVERVIGGVFSDRPRYVPGAPVRLFGVLRGQTRLPRGGIGHLSGNHNRLAYRVVSETEEEIAAGHTTLGPAGLFRIDFRLSRAVQPGRYTTWLHLPGTRRAYADWVLGSFRVIARRRGLALTLAAPANVLMHQRPEVRVSLREPSGRPAAGATVRWRLYRQGDAPPPSDQPDFRFGRAQGPAINPQVAGLLESSPEPGETVWVAGGVSTTDARGSLKITPRLSAPATLQSASFELVAEATTLDGRTVRRSCSVAARRRRLQLGMRPASYLVRVGEPLPVRLVSVDAQGRPLPASGYIVTAHRYDGPQPEARVRSTCRGDLALATGDCRLVLTRPGRYLLRARLSATMPAAQAPAEVVIYAHGAATTQEPADTPVQSAPAVEVIPGRRWYPEGARAQLLLRSPTSPATALVTLERDGIVHARAVRLKGPDTLVSLDLGRGLTPNVWVGASVVGAHHPHPLPPAALSERIRLAIRPAVGHLRVALQTPRRQALPGARLPVSLQITDRRGRPVSAAVMLLLQPDTADPPPDLAACLQRDRGPGIALRTSTAHRAAARPRWRPSPGPRPEKPSSGIGDGPDGTDPAEGYTDDQTTPSAGLFFRGPVQTDAQGRLSFSVPLPRRHGRYRLVALAADRLQLHQLGRDILPLTVKPALGLTLAHPETLRIGDRVSVVAQVQNHTRRLLRVTVLARADRLPITSRARHLTLAPGARAQATFAARATRVGLARLQVAAVAETHRAALEHRVLVQPSSRDQAVRRLGVVRSTAALALRRAAASPTSPRHTLVLSNSPLGVGLSALRWLLVREALTLEAAAARLLALSIAHRHRRTTLRFLLPDTTARRSLCRRAMRQIMDLELPRGGLRRYDGGPPARPPGLAFALLALGQSRATGCLPPRPLITALTHRLQTIAADPNAEPAARVTALAALHRHRGSSGARGVQPLMRHWRRFPLVVQGRLLRLIPGAARRRALTKEVDHRLVASTDPRPDAHRVELIARRLLSTLGRAPRPDSVQSWIARLLAQGRSGRWGAARATSWALLALSQAESFLARSRKAVQARAWLDGRHWGGRALRPGRLDLIRLRTGRRLDLDPGKLILRARGAARLYFLLTRVVRRAPRSVIGASASLSVQLTPAVTSSPPAPGKPLPLEVGANAIGRVTLVTTRSIPSTVLRVPVPAGCEVVDPGLPRQEQGSRHRYPPPPILDATVRDGVLRLHLADLPPGIHEHRLVIQATTAGRFGCAPATLRRGTDERLLARAARCRPLRVSPRQTAPQKGATP